MAVLLLGMSGRLQHRSCLAVAPQCFTQASVLLLGSQKQLYFFYVIFRGHAGVLCAAGAHGPRHNAGDGAGCGRARDRRPVLAAVPVGHPDCHSPAAGGPGIVFQHSEATVAGRCRTLVRSIRHHALGDVELPRSSSSDLPSLVALVHLLLPLDGVASSNCANDNDTAGLLCHTASLAMSFPLAPNAGVPPPPGAGAEGLGVLAGDQRRRQRGGQRRPGGLHPHHRPAHRPQAHEAARAHRQHQVRDLVAAGLLGPARMSTRWLAGSRTRLGARPDYILRLITAGRLATAAHAIERSSPAVFRNTAQFPTHISLVNYQSLSA